MAIPTYHPLPRFDHKFSIFAMALGAAWFTVAVAASQTEPKTPADLNLASWSSIISSLLLFFMSFFRLVLDSWYHGRAWWKLLFWSCGSSASGAAQLLGFTGLVPIAIGMWAWVFAMGMVVFGTDFLVERDGVEAGRGRGAQLTEFSDDAQTPQKPATQDPPRGVEGAGEVA